MSAVKLPHNTHIIDHRKPMMARAEETLVQTGLTTADAPMARRGIRWHLNTESMQRIRDLMACWQCLATFPARPCAMNVAMFKDYKHCRPAAVANRLIRAGCCPVCGAEISSGMFETQDEGDNPLNNRSDDDD